MKKYYLSFIFSFCFLLGCIFVGSSDVYASPVKDKNGFNCTDVDASFSYLLTGGNLGGISDPTITLDIVPGSSSVYVIPLMYLYKDEYYVEFYMASLKPFTFTYHHTGFDADPIYVSFSSNGYYVTVQQNVDIGSVINTSFSYLFSDSLSGHDKLVFSYLNGTCPDENIYPMDSSFDEVSAEYDPNIGYLENVQSKNLFLNDSPSIESGDVPYMEKISYNYKTSTGFDIRQKGVQIQYGFYVHGYGRFLGGIGSKIDVPDYKSPFYYSSTDVNYITINNTMFTSLVDSWKAGTDKLHAFSGVYYGIDKWLRVVYFDGSKSYYGGWTQISVDEDDNDSISIVNQGVTNDGQIGSNLDRIDDSSTLDRYSGYGDTFEEAEINSNYVNDSNASGDVQANFNSLVSMVGNIPIIFSRLFSFLPPWCLAFVGICFTILVVLMVKSAIF